MNTPQLFQRVADVLFYVTEATNAKKTKVKSALQRVRDLSSHHFLEALVKRIRLAFKVPGYRSYPVDLELWFAEFGRLLDLDGDSEEVREEAFVATLPLLVQEYPSLRTIFATQKEDSLVFAGFVSMARHFLPRVQLQDLATLVRLERMVVVPLRDALRKRSQCTRGGPPSSLLIR